MKFIPGTELDPSTIELGDVWPRFLLNDKLSNRYWNRLYEDFPEYQFVLEEDGRVIAEGNCVPVKGMPLQWRDAIRSAWEDDGEPDRVSALAIIIAPDQQGRGLSEVMLTHMKEVAGGLLVAPVRPTLKSRYPLTPIADYATWRREDGSHFDPWLRVHERVGGRILGPAEEAMLIEGDRFEWEEWTGMAFPASGDYVVPGALVPVRFEHSRGVYREPCVWVEHTGTLVS
jgi:GNAT superfamily N-acetyltransferase